MPPVGEWYRTGRIWRRELRFGDQKPIVLEVRPTRAAGQFQQIWTGYLNGDPMDYTVVYHSAVLAKNHMDRLFVDPYLAGQ